MTEQDLIRLGRIAGNPSDHKDRLSYEDLALACGEIRRCWLRIQELEATALEESVARMDLRAFEALKQRRDHLEGQVVQWREAAVRDLAEFEALKKRRDDLILANNAEVERRRAAEAKRGVPLAV